MKNSAPIFRVTAVLAAALAVPLAAGGVAAASGSPSAGLRPNGPIGTNGPIGPTGECDGVDQVAIVDLPVADAAEELDAN